MDSYQNLRRVAHLLHVPGRLYDSSGVLIRCYQTASQQDPLVCDTDFRVRLMELGCAGHPVLYIELKVMLYGILRLPEGKICILGPGCLSKDDVSASRKLAKLHHMDIHQPYLAAQLPLRAFCEALLLLDDFHWGRNLSFETLLSLNFSGQTLERLLAQFPLDPHLNAEAVPAPTRYTAQEDSFLVSRCKEEVRRRLHTKVTVEELAKSLDLSPSYLSRMFHKEQGITITDYVAQEKIRAAQNMLLTTDLSYEAIAYELGFSSQSYFGAVFKRLTGVTPREYRLQKPWTKSSFK